MKKSQRSDLNSTSVKRNKILNSSIHFLEFHCREILDTVDVEGTGKRRKCVSVQTHYHAHDKSQRKMFFVLSREWNKEKILSSHEESTLTTEPQKLHGERGLLRSSYQKRPAYCQDQQCIYFFEFLIFAFQVANSRFLSILLWYF